MVASLKYPSSLESLQSRIPHFLFPSSPESLQSWIRPFLYPYSPESLNTGPIFPEAARKHDDHAGPNFQQQNPPKLSAGKGREGLQNKK